MFIRGSLLSCLWLCFLSGMWTRWVAGLLFFVPLFEFRPLLLYATACLAAIITMVTS
jgi:hypothetical protein